jgi:hypothetical protein
MTHTPGALESYPVSSLPRITDIPSRAECGVTYTSLFRTLRLRYDTDRGSSKGASGGVVILSREGERWRRLIGESELVKLWNNEHAG